MTQAKQLFDQPGIALAALGLREVKELSNREIAGMRGHKVEKSSFGVGITEDKELGELVSWHIHGLKA